MRNPRLFIPGGVHFITFRTEEGLPFVPLQFMNLLILSAIARAMALYPVQLIGFTVQANHVHMLIRVLNPVDASEFVGYFKAESARYLNSLLGRKKHTVWEERFDSPVVLDLDEALEKLAYAILNPVKDGLVNSMQDYPGVSSFPYLLEGTSTLEVRSIPRNEVPQLKDPSRPILQDLDLSKHFSSDRFEKIALRVEPEAIMLTFPEVGASSADECRQLLISFLKKQEERLQAEREGKKPLGVRALRSQSVLKPHTPPSNGKKMICLSSCRELRRNFISFFKALRRRCIEVYDLWKKGETHIPFPSGMFPPRMPRRANLLPPYAL